MRECRVNSGRARTGTEGRNGCWNEEEGKNQQAAARHTTQGRDATQVHELHTHTLGQTDSLRQTNTEKINRRTGVVLTGVVVSVCEVCTMKFALTFVMQKTQWWSRTLC